MWDAGAIIGRLKLETGPFAQGMLQANSIMSIFPQTVTNFLANPLQGVIGLAKSAAGAIADTISAGIRLAASNEQVAISYEVLTGSVAKASKLMADIREFATTTPFRLEEINDAGKQLLAFGIESEQVVTTLRRLGDISSALGVPLKDMAYLFGTTAVQGRIFTQDLNQFTSRGIPLIDEIARQFGVTKDQVKKLVEEGKVGFPEVEKAIVALTSSGGRFSGMTERQSQSLLGLWSTLQDTWSAVEQKLGEGVLKGLDANKLVADLTGLVERLGPTIVKAGEMAVRGIQGVIAVTKQMQEGFMHFVAVMAAATDNPIEFIQDPAGQIRQAKLMLDFGLELMRVQDEIDRKNRQATPAQPPVPVVAVPASPQAPRASDYVRIDQGIGDISAAAAAAQRQAAGIAPAGGAGGVNVTIAPIDEDRLSQALAAYVAPLVDQRVSEAERAAQTAAVAAAYQRGTRGRL